VIIWIVFDEDKNIYDIFTNELSARDVVYDHKYFTYNSYVVKERR